MLYFNMISGQESSGNWRDGGAATLDMIVDFTRSRDLEIAPIGDSVRQESISDSMIVDCVR